MFSHIKDRKQNFHSVARVMPQGGTCGCLGESKTIAWGFAMAPYRLRALVIVSFTVIGSNKVFVNVT